MAIEKEFLDQLLAGRAPDEVFAKEGLLDELKKALSERILNAELDEHLGDEREAGGAANRRRGPHERCEMGFVVDFSGDAQEILKPPPDELGALAAKPVGEGAVGQALMNISAHGLRRDHILRALKHERSSGDARKVGAIVGKEVTRAKTMVF